MDHSDNNHKFKKHVEDYVKNKIKDVKLVDEIMLDLRQLNVEKYFNSTDLDISYKNFLRSRKILQIFINSFNSYETYKSMTFKFNNEDNDSFKSFGSHFIYDAKLDEWMCKSRPTECDVSLALYNYTLYQQSIENKHKMIDIGDQIEKCTYCDGEISLLTEMCTVCEAPLSQMIDSIKTDQLKVRNGEEREIKVKGKEEKVTDTRSLEKIFNGESSASGHLNNDRSEEVVERNAKSTHCDKNEERLKKWICGSCGFLNDYKMLNCEVCDKGFLDGKWKCRSCYSCDNSCKDDHCDSCGSRNENLKCEEKTPKLKEDCQLNMMDGWICTHCTVKNPDSVKICTCCAKSKAGSEDAESLTAVIKSQWQCGDCNSNEPYNITECSRCRIDRAKCGLWTCHKCTFKNKCFNKICDACDELNKLLEVSACTFTNNPAPKVNTKSLIGKNMKKNEVIKPNQWQCKNSNCGKCTNLGKEYCGYCMIHQSYSGNRGEEFRKLKKGHEVRGWICPDCFTFNDLIVTICSKEGCTTPRY